MTRVLHLAKLDPRTAGGIERFVRDLSTAQRARGNAVRILACGLAARNAEADPELVLAPSFGTLLYLPLSPSYPLVARREILRSRPDCVHLHWPNPWAALLEPLLPAQTRLIVHWHADMAVEGGPPGVALAYRVLFRHLERRLLHRAERVIATSSAYAEASTALAPARAKVAIVPLGIAAEETAVHAAAPAWPLRSGLRVLFVGRLVPYKGVDLLLEALRHSPDAQLLVLGEGPERLTLEHTALRLGLGARVRFCGHVDEATKMAALAACDLLCLPSRNRLEAFGMVLLEAAQCGAPVLVADVPGSGIGEVARQLPGARLVRANDVAALAEALAATPARADALRAVPPAHDDRFAIERVAEAIDAVYAAG